MRAVLMTGSTRMDPEPEPARAPLAAIERVTVFYPVFYLMGRSLGL